MTIAAELAAKALEAGLLLSRNGNGAARGVRKEIRTDAHAGARPVRSGGIRKPALTAGAKAGNAKQFGFTSRPKPETKKRG